MLAIPLRNLRFASLPLLFVSVACIAFAQGSTTPNAQVRPHFELPQAALRANDSASAEIDPRAPGVHYELADAILESAPNDAAAQAGLFEVPDKENSEENR